MRLSSFSIVDSFPEGTGAGRDRYEEVLRLAEAGDGAGLETFWVAEHHFQPGGLCPAPAVLLAAAAERTRRIRLGVMVSVLPFHSPVDLAEQYALVDRLSHGRLRLGVGSGYIPVEFEGFGVDPARKRELFDTALERLLAAFRGDPVAPMDGPGPRRALNVLPVQQPHPPLTLAVQRREAIPFVARRGIGIGLVPYATVQDLDELSGLIQEYRRHLPEANAGRVAAAVHLYAGAHPERARSAFQRFLNSRLETQSTFYQAKVKEHPHHASAETLERLDLAVFGTPREVATRLDRWRSAGVDELLGIFDFGGLPLDDVTSSVAALGRELSGDG